MIACRVYVEVVNTAAFLAPVSRAVRYTTRCFTIGALVLSAAVTACSSGDNGPTTPRDHLIRIGGTYATSVILGPSSCPNIVVQNMATTVTHSTGTTVFSLRHAAITATGSVQADGGFTTKKANVAVGRAMHTLSISGRFSANGFEALLTVTVIQPVSPHSCVYQLAWFGTKQGTPNTIPGT